MEEGVFAIIGFFGSISLIVWFVCHYRFKTKAKSAELIDSMIVNGKDVTPELIKAVGFAPKRAHGDLRTSLILGAIGTAMFIFGHVIPEDEAQLVFAGLASFPFLLGLAFFGFWFFISRKEDQ